MWDVQERATGVPIEVQPCKASERFALSCCFLFAVRRGRTFSGCKRVHFQPIFCRPSSLLLTHYLANRRGRGFSIISGLAMD